MTADDAAYDAALALWRAGHWDAAAAAAAPPRRAEILVDRHWWRLDDPAEAHAAVARLTASDPALAGYLDAQLAYTRLLFGLDIRPGDAARARAGFAAAQDRLPGWATFWLGVLTENVDHEPAADHYQRAHRHAAETGDTLLESYTARHLGANLLDSDRQAGLTLLRRSYHLRAALGARPQTAAAAVLLASSLSDGEETAQLRGAAALTARELRLTWLLEAF